MRGGVAPSSTSPVPTSRPPDASTMADTAASAAAALIAEGSVPTAQGRRGGWVGAAACQISRAKPGHARALLQGAQDTRPPAAVAWRGLRPGAGVTPVLQLTPQAERQAGRRARQRAIHPILLAAHALGKALRSFHRGKGAHRGSRRCMRGVASIQGSVALAASPRAVRDDAAAARLAGKRRAAPLSHQGGPAGRCEADGCR